MERDVVICGFYEVWDWCRDRDFAWVVSIGEPGDVLPEPLDEDDPRVLRLEFFDTAPFDYDPSGPQVEDVEALVAFCDDAIEAGGDALFHCAQGVSRSSASALVYLAMAMGPGREAEAVYRIQQAPGGFRASPNTRIVEIADEILDRSGALSGAMEAAFYPAE